MAGVDDGGLGVSGFPGDGLFFFLLHIFPFLSGVRFCGKEENYTK
jgi:hypothetical protein